MDISLITCFEPAQLCVDVEEPPTHLIKPPLDWATSSFDLATHLKLKMSPIQ